MDCLIHLLAVCLFDPSNVAVSAAMESPIVSPHRVHYNATTGDVISSEGPWCTRNWCHGPIGVLKLYVEIPATRELTVSYGLSHRSYLDEGDRGYESWFVTATWRPFKRE